MTLDINQYKYLVALLIEKNNRLDKDTKKMGEYVVKIEAELHEARTALGEGITPDPSVESIVTPIDATGQLLQAVTSSQNVIWNLLKSINVDHNTYHPIKHIRECSAVSCKMATQIMNNNCIETSQLEDTEG